MLNIVSVSIPKKQKRDRAETIRKRPTRTSTRKGKDSGQEKGPSICNFKASTRLQKG